MQENLIPSSSKNSYLIDANFAYLSEGPIHANISEDNLKDAREIYRGHGRL